MHGTQTWYLCLQEVLRIDKQQGLIALGRFKSCVRTSLLLCGGYECQEKEGTFMIAFPHPRAAVEWALTLQLALLRYNSFTVNTSLLVYTLVGAARI